MHVGSICYKLSHGFSENSTPDVRSVGASDLKCFGLVVSGGEEEVLVVKGKRELRKWVTRQWLC